MSESSEKQIRIIVAEDFAILRDDLIETLEKQKDMTVVGAAANGKEVIRIAEKTDFDVALLDIEMDTARDGIDAAEQILAKKEDAIIIFLTAHETEPVILSSMETGATDYFIKGNPEEELLTHIRSAYQGQPIMLPEIQQSLLKEYSRLRQSEQSLLYFIGQVSKLTETEFALIRLLLKGKTNREIAEIRYVELSTVKSQISVLLKKFDCRRTKEIVQIIEDLNIAYLFENRN